MKMNEIETLFLDRMKRVIGKNGLKRECHDYSYFAKISTDDFGLKVNYEIDFEYISEEHLSGHMYIQPQYKVQVYTVDFLFSGNIDGICPSVALEIDGHEWHEKTKEQAMRDRRRDRNLLLNMLPIFTMRFTGSEIYNNAKEPYYDVLDYPASFSVAQKLLMLDKETYEEVFING